MEQCIHCSKHEGNRCAEGDKIRPLPSPAFDDCVKPRHLNKCHVLPHLINPPMGSHPEVDTSQLPGDSKTRSICPTTYIDPISIAPATAPYAPTLCLVFQHTSASTSLSMPKAFSFPILPQAETYPGVGNQPMPAAQETHDT